MRLRFRLQAWFWDSAPLFLPPLRRLKRAASLLLYRWRGLGRALPPRVVAEAPRHRTAPLASPLVAVHLTAGAGGAEVERWLADQTESSLTTDPAAAEGAAFGLTLDRVPEALPATWLESQVLAMTAEELEWTACGWAAPATDRYGPAAEVAGSETTPCPGLVRLPAARDTEPPPVHGRAVPHVTAPERVAELDARILEPRPDAVSSGPYRLRPDVRPGTVVRRRLASLSGALASLPVEPGPPTALFLLPFLAVGGAESLLFDLLAGLAGRYRLLVVTVEPHRAELGQTLDQARALTPHVYTLGDWLPRPAHDSALSHLIRRYAVQTLMSWNGTVFFYDVAAALKRDHPRLRVVNQLFNHRGGWIEHYGRRLIDSVDLHVAVNRPIGRALAEERGVPGDRLAVIHHGVRLPGDAPDDARAERRRQARRDFRIPQDAVVAGAFMRMHPQKRPFDVLRLARRVPEVHFLLAGGGPLDAAIDRELARRPIANLTRLPMRRDVERLYDAVDLCLLPSAFEGLPVFLLDGLARRIPCVATAVGDVPLLLRDGGGVLIERVGDSGAMAAALKTLSDPQRRAAEGERGRAAVAERFGLERYVRAYQRALFPAAETR